MSPVGLPLPANQFKVSVATAAAPTTFFPVSLMQTYDISAAENNASFDVFDSDDPIEFAGKQRRTFSITGYLADGTDSGQQTLFQASAGKLTVVLKVLWDGSTNGFTQVCRVNAYKGGAKAGNNPLTASFDFMPTTAAGTIIGTGPLL